MLLLLMLTACSDKLSDEEPSADELDQDGDGFPETTDCDDHNAAIHPEAAEVCDMVDNDCDGAIDSEDDDVDWRTGTLSYADQDGDGYGSIDNSAVVCVGTAGYTSDNTDCDDLQADVHPQQVEVCGDNIDNECDLKTDCEDDDCLSVCIEDCGDGADNDMDGLIDCEDGDCYSTCLEDCGDKIDNDMDDLVDCEDDDCLFECEHPAGVKVMVTGGHLEQVRRRDIDRWHFNAYGDQTFITDLTGVTGIVQVLPNSISSWSSADTVLTCSWSIDAVAMNFHSTVSDDRWDYFADQPTRSGLWIESGCDISSKMNILPLSLQGRSAQTHVVTQSHWESGDNPRVLLWYNGQVNSIVNLRFSQWGGPDEHYNNGGDTGSIRSTWLSADLNSGGIYHVLP